MTEARSPSHEIQFLNLLGERSSLCTGVSLELLGAVLHCMGSVCLNVANKDESRVGDGERPSFTASSRSDDNYPPVPFHWTSHKYVIFCVRPCDWVSETCN